MQLTNWLKFGKTESCIQQSYWDSSLLWSNWQERQCQGLDDEQCRSHQTWLVSILLVRVVAAKQHEMVSSTGTANRANPSMLTHDMLGANSLAGRARATIHCRAEEDISWVSAAGATTFPTVPDIMYFPILSIISSAITSGYHAVALQPSFKS